MASQENTCFSCVAPNRRAAHVPLQRDHRRAGGAAREQRREAQHREHREGNRKPGAELAPNTLDRHRALQAVPVGVAAGRQRQEDLRQRVQREQHAHRRSSL
jgi:hypothetical protein